MSLKIKFTRSRTTVEWNDQYGSILELAEDNGIALESDCQMGICGTCKVKLLSGEVAMETEDGLSDRDREEGMVLPCVAVPTTDVAIEA